MQCHSITCLLPTHTHYTGTFSSPLLYSYLSCEETRVHIDLILEVVDTKAPPVLTFGLILLSLTYAFYDALHLHARLCMIFTCLLFGYPISS